MSRLIWRRIEPQPWRVDTKAPGGSLAWSPEGRGWDPLSERTGGIWSADAMVQGLAFLEEHCLYKPGDLLDGRRVLVVTARRVTGQFMWAIEVEE